MRERERERVQRGEYFIICCENFAQLSAKGHIQGVCMVCIFHFLFKFANHIAKFVPFAEINRFSEIWDVSWTAFLFIEHEPSSIHFYLL